MKDREKTDKLNRPIMSKEIESVIKKLPPSQDQIASLKSLPNI